MMKKMGKGTVLGFMVLVALAVSATAVAATPSQIYADYADNNRLDSTYSDADLQAALNSAVVQGYGRPTVTPGFRTAVKQQLNEDVAETAQPSSTLPFTGIDLALLTAGAVLLLLLGWGFRRIGRARS
jgi:hypothetical protein